MLFSSQLSYAGVNYCTRYTDSTVWTWKSYIKKIKHFHQCPMVKMCYHFVSLTLYFCTGDAVLITMNLGQLYLVSTRIQLYDVVQVQ